VQLEGEYPHLEVLPVVADYTRDFVVPATARVPARRCVYYPGSTIGNFEPPEARRFLARAARLVGPGGVLLVGVDLKKDRSLLEAAYDDREGVTPSSTSTSSSASTGSWSRLSGRRASRTGPSTTSGRGGSRCTS